MKRLLVLAMCIFACAFANARAADPPTAWGVPLGVTAEELRASYGPPTTMRTPGPLPTMLGMPFPGPRLSAESWQYNRGGTRLYVTFSQGRVKTVGNLGNFSPDLSSIDATVAADPLGLRIGDTVGALLVKSGAVKAIEPNSGMSFTTAMIHLRRGNLSYQFSISIGRIESEWITLID